MLSRRVKIFFQTSFFSSALPLRLTLIAGVMMLPTQYGYAQNGTSREIGSVDFGRDVRPILADTCFKCHGPDEHDRKAGLRLDDREDVFEEFGSVVPGDLESSELYQRLISDDPDSLMPPSDSGRKLSGEQIDLIKRWIEQGAQWENHWSLTAPVKAELPKVKKADWSINEIDRFILSRLEQKKLQPNEGAKRAVLIRRVAFDLTGLPPAQELVKKYRESKTENWYEQLVNELLAADQYGEHMARYWLDAARYGDTHGLHLDNYREMWLYRDWVINAFNQNMPFDDFVIEQLAGDMLENATDEQKIASGFNRAHVTTNEGGSIIEEVYVRNVVDRVSTTGTVFMGLTVGCAQCHDHKFDPISQKEFYQLFAYFNNLAEKPMDDNIKDPKPVLVRMDDEQKTEMKRLESESESAKIKIEEMLAEYQYVDPADEKTEGENDTDESSTADEATASEAVDDKQAKKFTWVGDILPAGVRPEGNWNFVTSANGPVQSGETSRLQVAADKMEQHFFTKAISPLRVHAGDRFFANVFLDPKDPPEEIMLQFNDGDWSHRVYWGSNKIDWGTKGDASRIYAGELPESGKWIQLEVPVDDVGFKKATLINGMAFTQWGGTAHWDSAGVFSSLDQTSEFVSLSRWLKLMKTTKGEGLPKEIKKLVNKKPEKLDDKQKIEVRNYFLESIHRDARQEFKEPMRRRNELAKELEEFKKTLPTTLISKEGDTVKDAFVLNRGEYDQKGDKVERATPAALPAMPADALNNRLGLAHWLVADENPLTARVTVNRFWQQLFGTGIVKTSEDFGAQGDVPSHPDLLDWLAIDFRENDWDVKRLMKLMVMSASYRQSSGTTPELVVKDPDNRLLARGPRFRLDAEALRDQALAVSGLLVSEIGGPSVKPPQPDGLWFVVGYSGSNTVRFKKDMGPDKVHRRSLYTFWKRTAPPPQMNTFDAPSREECSVRRERTNTPLQALLLMNDPQYVEAARYLAQKTIDSRQGDEERIAFMFESALARTPNSTEVNVLRKSLRLDVEEFKAQAETVNQLAEIGEQAADKKYERVELAAWTMLANLIMNMDEFVTKN